MLATLIRALRGHVGTLTRRLVAALRRRWRREWIYADDVVLMDDVGLTIRRYYWPWGRKRIPYTEIRHYRTRPLTLGRGQYRVHGIDLRGRWYSRDPRRGSKGLSIVLHLGGLIDPVLTPSDPAAVLEVLEDHVRHAG